MIEFGIGRRSGEVGRECIEYETCQPREKHRIASCEPAHCVDELDAVSGLRDGVNHADPATEITIMTGDGNIDVDTRP